MAGFSWNHRIALSARPPIPAGSPIPMMRQKCIILLVAAVVFASIYNVFFQLSTNGVLNHIDIMTKGAWNYRRKTGCSDQLLRPFQEAINEMHVGETIEQKKIGNNRVAKYFKACTVGIIISSSGKRQFKPRCWQQTERPGA